MAVRSYALPILENINALGVNRGRCAFFVCDSSSDLPSSSMAGDRAYLIDVDEFRRWDGAAWVDDTGGSSGGGAPTTADYLVKTADAGLSAERVVTDTSSITWDWATAGQAKAKLAIASEARGDIIYRGASDWARLAAGTSGKTLHTKGAGADPAWEKVDLADEAQITGLLSAAHLPADANVVLARFGKTTITATATPTSIASTTIAGGVMGVNSTIVTWLWGSYFNNSGANRGVRVVLDIGGSTRIDASSVTTYLGANATIRRAWWMQVVFKNVDATNVNWCHINMAQSGTTPGAMSGAPATGTGGWELGFAGAGGQFSCNGEMAIDTAAGGGVPFNVKLCMNNATATQEWICEGGVMLLQ